MANIDLSQLFGTPDASTPTAGQMPQQPMVPQQFPISNPLLQAAQSLGGALQGNPNVQGAPPVGLGDMLPSIPQNKWQALAMLAGPILGMAGKFGGVLSKTVANPELNPTKIGMPDLFDRINARNVLHHSTNLDAGQSILEEGAIIPKRYTDKFMGWGKDTTPDIAGERAGFTGPRTSLSRAQRVGDPITFEIDPNYVKNPKPVEALHDKARTGAFEFESGTQEPIPAEGIKNVLINTDRVNDLYGNQAPARIARIRALAAQRGIPVIEGTENELLSRRPLGMQGPMRPIQSQPIPEWFDRLAGSPTSTLKKPGSY